MYEETLRAVTDHVGQTSPPMAHRLYRSLRHTIKLILVSFLLLVSPSPFDHYARLNELVPQLDPLDLRAL